MQNRQFQLITGLKCRNQGKEDTNLEISLFARLYEKVILIELIQVYK
jgi:hypothetical protein